ncbi:hypothetical protein [Mesorhizobium sp. B263B2A]|uniref:hypothetical protein n=1 Tax=Mesorhizobium sp. B263B2A TaxID=2876669 RepID=UPI001CD1039A|nr:hypothetical protein [Mesorhizobium sp. B263B2A]MCA0034767.1 hypothetical protein [Mesorhizobium sp. B263B2A]
MSDLGTNFRNGRPESEAIMLGAERPAARPDAGTNFIDALSHALRTPDVLT